MNLVRRAVPFALLPLALIGCALASSPWLRAFPSSVMAVPLFGAALLSVLAPLIVVGIGVRKLWLTALIDLVIFVFYELLVTLREPVGFNHLYTGLVHGPSQILSFALPLVSPRTLLVAPVALCWLSGAIVGECVARGWQSVLPYITLLVTFGLSYAGTARAISSASDGRRYDTLLAGTLLLALLLLRAAQAWVAQDHGAETTQPDGILPLRGLAIGAILAVFVAFAAAGAVQSSSFTGQPATPARVPPVDQSRPLTPVSFVASLRPSDPSDPGTELFKVTVDRPTSNYISLASVDYYDGDGWSFDRTFRPSGGVVPADLDPQMRPKGAPVDQQYTIDKGPLTSVPWMPFLDRVQKVTGATVNIDATSGMIVPSHELQGGENYTVRSAVPTETFDQLGRTSLISTSAAQVDTTLANGLSVPLGTLVTSLAAETGTSSDQVVPFLQAVANDFRTKSALAGAPSATSSASQPAGQHFLGGLPAVAPKPSPKPTPKTGAKHGPPAHPTSPPAHPSTPVSSAAPSTPEIPHTGGTTFADVLASIRASHSATPEQYATLMALIARKLNVPARVVAGFRIPLPAGAHELPARTYAVTTADAWTWVEIPVRGVGWVVLDPSPGTYAGQQPPQSEGATPSPTPTPTVTPNAQLTQSNQGGHAVAPHSKVPHSSGISALTITLIVLACVVAALALFVGWLLLRKLLRVRRRRRAGDPRRRLLGAWQESLDVLVEAGLPELSTLTSAEVSARTTEQFGGEPGAQARYIGDAANLAIFSPTSWIGPEEADAAWRAQAVLAKSVRRRLGVRARIGAGLRYHRPHRVRARPAPASWLAASRSTVATGRRRRARGRRRR